MHLFFSQTEQMNRMLQWSFYLPVSNCYRYTETRCTPKTKMRFRIFWKEMTDAGSDWMNTMCFVHTNDGSRYVEKAWEKSIGKILTRIQPPWISPAFFKALGCPETQQVQILRKLFTLEWTDRDFIYPSSNGTFSHSKQGSLSFFDSDNK